MDDDHNVVQQQELHKYEIIIDSKIIITSLKFVLVLFFLWQILDNCKFFELPWLKQLAPCFTCVKKFWH